MRLLVALVLFVHGVGHFMGVIPALRLLDVEGWTSHSWLLTDRIGDTAARAVSAVLFLAAMVGFVGAALGFLGWVVPHEWWRTLAIVSSVISLVTLALFWNAFVSFIPNKLGAIAVDVATLVGLLWLNWPADVAV